MHPNYVEQAKSFFDSFRCEHISEENIQVIKKRFQAPKYGDALTKYVHEEALKDDRENEEKVYFVIDENDVIVCYFSLKCGLLYRPENQHFLDEEKESLVGMLFDAMKKNDDCLLTQYKGSSLLENDWDELYSAAQNKLAALREKEADEGRSMAVFKVHPAIELSHFCRNGMVKTKPFNIPVGFGVFWRQIVPKIIDISQAIGCKYVYLFAANMEKKRKDDSGEDPRDLITYYHDSLNFRDVQELVMVKPEYDRNCHPMLQRISDLKDVKDSIWEQFEDVICETRPK